MIDEDEYSKKLGYLISNLQSLEFSLRLFLYYIIDVPLRGETIPRDILSLREGDWVSENHLTNYDTLDVLIKKANKIQKINNKTIKVTVLYL